MTRNTIFLSLLLVFQASCSVLFSAGRPDVAGDGGSTDASEECSEGDINEQNKDVDNDGISNVCDSTCGYAAMLQLNPLHSFLFEETPMANAFATDYSPRGPDAALKYASLPVSTPLAGIGALAHSSGGRSQSFNAYNNMMSPHGYLSYLNITGPNALIPDDSFSLSFQVDLRLAKSTILNDGQTLFGLVAAEQGVYPFGQTRQFTIHKPDAAPLRLLWKDVELPRLSEANTDIGINTGFDMVTLVFDKMAPGMGTVSLYINSELVVEQGPVAAPVTTGHIAVLIGGRTYQFGTAGRCDTWERIVGESCVFATLEGYIDDFLVFDEALSQAEVQMLHANYSCN